MSKTIVIATFLAATLAGGLVPAAWGEECTIRMFGGPNRLFQPMRTTDDLKQVLKANEADVRQTLARSGWQGTPEDFFEALDEGAVEERIFPVGQPFQWMAFRRSGQPVVYHQKCWGGDEPFAGFAVTVTSRGRKHTFAIPKVCGNLALIQSERVAEVKLPPPPEPPPEPPKALCDVMVDEHHVKDDEDLRVDVRVSHEDLVKNVRLRIERRTDKKDEAPDEYELVDEVVLDGSPFTWEGSLEKDGNYKLVAFAIGDTFTTSPCEDRVEVD